MQETNWHLLKQEIAKRIGELTGVALDTNQIEEPPKQDAEYGDLAFPCFALAKAVKKPPQQIAEELAKKFGKIDKIKEVKTVNAYLNFYIDWQSFGQQLLEQINESYGKASANKIAVIDFSSPNPAHPLHIGHARTTILGEAVCRLLESQGWIVHRVNYINDIGKQLAKLAIGYKLFGRGQSPSKQEKPDHWLWKFYILFHKKLEKEPSLEQQADKFVYDYELGEKKTRALGRKIVLLCLKGFKQTYKALGIKFDDYIFESDFVEQGRAMAKDCLKKGIAFKADGTIVADMQKHGIDNTVLLRSDGTGLYLTRDVPATIYKFQKYKPQLNVWVVGEEQTLFFKQELKILEMLSYEEYAKKSHHLSYGLVNLKEGKMASRLGRAVLIDDMIQEAVRRAKQKIKQGTSTKLAKKISEAVGLAAIKYDILKYSPEKSISFSWDSALRLEGDSGPYLQYTHARANSILRRAGRTIPKRSVDAKYLKEPQEIAVLKFLAKYPEVLEKAASDLRPHYLACYLHELADAFNTFYQALPVLKTEKQTRNARLKLVEATATVMKIGLELLGITAPEKM